MSVEIIDKLSLLAQRPVLESNQASGFTVSANAFASKLKQALDSASTSPVTEQNKAESMAQLLKLQMLQSSLTLSDADIEPYHMGSPVFSKALFASYNANSPNESKTESSSILSPSESTSKSISKEQLNDLANSLPVLSSENTSNTKTSMATAWLDPIIFKASKRYGVDSALIKAVIKAESDFNPKAVSRAGAKGLMQLMPATARVLGVADSFDPEQNVMAGTRFLADMLKRYDGDVDSALAAYNWGPGNVDKRTTSLPKETREYQARVKKLYGDYSA